MAVGIGERWLENLVDVRALVREALQGHKPDEFHLYALRKENLTVTVSCCNRRVCYECGEKIEEREGIMLNISESGILFLTRKPFKRDLTYFFHKYHF